MQHLCVFFFSFFHLHGTDYTYKGMTAHHLQICNHMSDLAMLGSLICNLGRAERFQVQPMVTTCSSNHQSRNICTHQTNPKKVFSKKFKIGKS